MRILQVNNSFTFLIALSLFVNAVSFEHFTGVYDRWIFKFLSVSILLFVLLMKHRSLKLKKNDYAYLMIPLFFFSLFVSDIINNGVMSLNAFIRFAASTIFIIIILNYSKEELLKLIQQCTFLFMVLGLIGIFLVSLKISSGEKIPFLNIYSTKSIFFEQNIYGICMFFLFISIGKFIKPSFLSISTSVLAIFSSYYRTVYLFVIIRSFFTKYFPLFLISLVMLLIYFAYELSLIIKIDQISTLTGRDVLWMIGLEGFFDSPLIGLGESAIPGYSNEVLNRDPAYTTYHNAFIDILFSGGLVSFIVYLLILLHFFFKTKKLSWFFVAFFLFAPSMLNTYYVFSFNILGGFIGIVLMYMDKIQREYV